MPSEEIVKYSYILECLLTRQMSVLVIGPSTSGRSALMRNLLFDGIYDFSKKLISEHVTLSKHSNCSSFRTMVEAMLECKPTQDGQIRRLRPPNKNKLLIYIQDLHLSGVDRFGDQSAVEVIREFLTVSGWVSVKNLRQRQVEDLAFVADMAINSPTHYHVNERVLHRMSIISLQGLNLESFKVQIRTITDTLMYSWPWMDQNRPIYARKTMNALVDICQFVIDKLKPTPMKS